MIEQPSPEGARGYLRALGWTPKVERQDVSSHFELWSRGSREVLIPTSPSGPDLQRRWDELVSDLAGLTLRDASAIRDDLTHAAEDVFEVRVPGGSTAVSTDAARIILIEAREMFVVSGCATQERKPHHGRSRTKEARSLGRVVRLAQTRRGSFVFPFISPTTPSLIDGPAQVDEGLLVKVDEQLFPRRSMLTLTGSLAALHRLVSQESSPSASQLNEAVVRHGLSGDLCDAVADLADAPFVEEVTMSMRWSYIASRPTAEVTNLTFDREAAPVLRAAAERLHDAAQPGERIVFGYVKTLDRDHDEPEGTVKIRAVVDKKERLLTLVLSRADYDVAALAHAEDRRVVAQGQLHRPPGRTWTMTNLASFAPEARMDLHPS